MNKNSIGIDFGTSKTLVSRINPETGRPETLRLGRECDMIPSSVYIDEHGELIFGDDADDRLEDITGVYLRGFKMQLGSDMPVHAYLDSKGEFKQITAKDLVKDYLLYIRWRVETEFYQGEKVTKAVITRPVNFTPSQISQLRQAAIAAGFEQVEFTTEPEAAGLAYCRLNAATSFADSALVVDWGGGTLDFALVTRQGNSVSTHGHLTDGDMTMGGEKFDERLWRYVEKIAAEKGVTQLNHVTQMPKVRRCKEQLSSRQNVALHMSYELGACPAIPLRRQEFERLIEDDIDKAVQKLQALIKRIPIEHKPEMLLLVGGSSQIPLIKEKMEAACELPAYQWNLAREAVALGATLWTLKDYRIETCRVCGVDLILLGQSQLTCSHCNSTYQVSRAGQLSYDYSTIHCGYCGHNSKLNFPNQSSCKHCSAEFSWNKQQKKWDWKYGATRFSCRICGTQLTMHDSRVSCNRCSMKYSRKRNGEIITDGVRIECECNQVILVKSNSAHCPKCGRTLQWDKREREWVYADLSKSGTSGGKTQRSIKPCRVCGSDLILLGQSQLTCSHCNSKYQVSWAGQLSYDYSTIHCGYCGHNSRLNFPSQSSCTHCAAEFSWNKQQKKWDWKHGAVRFSCRICGTQLTMHDSQVSCNRCSMKYSRKRNGEIITDGVRIECECNYVILVQCNFAHCPKCGRTLRWDSGFEQWVYADLSKSGTSSGTAQRSSNNAGSGNSAPAENTTDGQDKKERDEGCLVILGFIGMLILGIVVTESLVPLIWIPIIIGLCCYASAKNKTK